MSKKNSTEVARELGITHSALLHLLVRQPDLRPAERIGNRNMFLWSDTEIEAVRAYCTAHPNRRTPNTRPLSARNFGTQ